jgi:hypothetical protein
MVRISRWVSTEIHRYGIPPEFYTSAQANFFLNRH